MTFFVLNAYSSAVLQGPRWNQVSAVHAAVHRHREKNVFTTQKASQSKERSNYSHVSEDELICRMKNCY